MKEEEKNTYLKKRQVILDTLELLFDEWEHAILLHSVVSSSEVTPELLDEIIILLDQSIIKMIDNEKKEKIEINLQSLKYMKQKELNDSEQEKLESNLILAAFI